MQRTTSSGLEAEITESDETTVAYESTNPRLSLGSKALIVMGSIGALLAGTAAVLYVERQAGNTAHANGTLDRCYTIKPGDTLSSIGNMMNPPLPWQDIFALNGTRLASPDRLNPGDTVALAPGACDHQDAVKMGQDLASSEKGITGESGYPYALSVTRPGETLNSLAKRLDVAESSIIGLNPKLATDSHGAILEDTLVVTPASQAARLEAHILHHVRELNPNSWQLASTIDEVTGPIPTGTEGINHIGQTLQGKDVKAVAIDGQTGQLTLFPGQVIAVYEDAKHRGRFITEVRTQFGNDVLVSLDSLIVKVSELPIE